MTDQIFYTEGAGNNFLFTLSETLKFQDLLGIAEKEGLAPDGFIVSKRVSENTLSFDFYNNDGSNVDFCGNALRAVGICYHKISDVTFFNLKTNVGTFSIEIKSRSMVEAQMPKPLNKGFVEVDGHKIHHIMSGVPHLVFDKALFGLNTNDEIKDFSKRVRSMDLGGVETVNLTFYEKETDPINCITFERGVEDFTLACGSGALSVAAVVGGDLVKLQMPGGLLEVVKRNESIYMLGPAKILDVF
jgi:diaminopimelate epimerase